MILGGKAIVRNVPQPRLLLLTLDAPPGAAGWPGPLAALPGLGGWLARAAQGAWPSGLAQAEPWASSLSAFVKNCVGMTMGLLNLPGLWPPPPLPGWCLPRPPAHDAQAYLAHPPELAWESADLAAGLTWFAGRRPARPHERDNRLAEAGACAWLVREHALRLAVEHPVAWLGLGFMGLREAWELCALAAGNLFALLLGQIDDHAAELSRLQCPEITCLLSGAGWAILAPGALKPGRVDDQAPDAVLALLARAAGGPPSPTLPPALAGLLRPPESASHA